MEKKKLTGADLSKLERAPVKRVDDFQKSIAKDIPREKIDTMTEWKRSTPAAMAEKLAKHRALREMSKKAMGVIPFAGTAYAAFQGDPAMAAEELAGDVPVLGQAYEAFKPEAAGNPEEERQMIAERNAQVDYGQSPAHLARLKALQAMRR